MNLNNYDAELQSAAESTESDTDDIVLGDVNSDQDTLPDPDTIMESVLESLCAMDADTLTATIKSLDDDSVCAICAAAYEACGVAMEAGGNGGNAPKPPKIPTAPEMKKLTSADIIAQGRGTGIIGAVKNSFLSGGRSKLDSSTIDMISNLGMQSGTNSYKRDKLMSSKASEQDKLTVGAKFDSDNRANKERVLQLVKSKTNDPRAIAAAMDLYKRSSSAQVSNHQAHSMALDTWRKDHKKDIDKYKKDMENRRKGAEARKIRDAYNAELQKKSPEAWKQYQEDEKRAKEDNLLKNLKKQGKGKFDEDFDRITNRVNKERFDSDARREESAYLDHLRSVDPKSADRLQRRNELTRAIEKRNRAEYKADAKEANKKRRQSFMENEMPTFNAAGKKVEAGAAHAKQRLNDKVKAGAAAIAAGGGIKQAFHDFATASTGEDTGLPSDINVQLITESINENGFGAYAFAFEKAYKSICVLESLSDDEFNAYMDMMSCTEATEFTEQVNIICDLLNNYDDYASCVEASMRDIDYATEDATPQPQPQPQPQPKPQPKPQPQPQNKPGIGERIRNFFSGAGSNTGFKDRVKNAASGLKNRISNWWNGTKPEQNNPAPAPKPNKPAPAPQPTPEQQQKQHRQELIDKAKQSEEQKLRNSQAADKQKAIFDAGAQHVDKDAQSALKERLLKEKAGKIAQQKLDEKYGGNAAKFGRSVGEKEMNAAKQQIHNSAMAKQGQRDADWRAASWKVKQNQIRSSVNNIKEKGSNIVNGIKNAFNPTPTPAVASVGYDFDEMSEALLESINFINSTADIYATMEAFSLEDINAIFETMTAEEAAMINDIFETNDLIEAFESAYDMMADENVSPEGLASAFEAIYDAGYGPAFECYVSYMIMDDEPTLAENVDEAIESMHIAEFKEFLDTCDMNELQAIEAYFEANDYPNINDIAENILDLDDGAMESVIDSLDGEIADVVLDAMTDIIEKSKEE